MNESYFEKFEFSNSFDQEKLRNFICNKTGEKFLKLVNMCSSHLRNKDGTIIIEVCKTQISLSFEEFVVVFYLTNIASLYTYEAHSVIKYLEFISSSQSLLIDPSASHGFPLTVEFMTLNVCLIHYVVAHILIPKKFNLGQVSKNYV